MSSPPFVPQIEAEPTFQSGVGIEAIYDISKCYVIGLLENRSKSMLATFPRDAKNPYSSILDYLIDDFGLGETRAVKAEGVRLDFLVQGALAVETRELGIGFLTMCRKIVAFKVSHEGISDPDVCGFEDKQLLQLNIRPGYPLVVGSKVSFLGDKELQAKHIAAVKSSRIS
ncbi:hypothetical protein B0O99DRAFT_630813 [Bisporella sp. PMI_857]|nr:hypothetical protein B0O99DRAFT_630813 [Bisporella sp. PMI_857]